LTGSFAKWALRLRILVLLVLLTDQLFNLERFRSVRSLNFDRGLHAHVRTVVAEKWISGSRRPLRSREKQAVTSAERKELLLGSRPEAALANYLAALAVEYCRCNDFCRTRGTEIDKDSNALNIALMDPLSVFRTLLSFPSP
jgi:hypothetical protein